MLKFEDKVSRVVADCHPSNSICKKLLRFLLRIDWRRQTELLLVVAVAQRNSTIRNDPPWTSHIENSAPFEFEPPGIRAESDDARTPQPDESQIDLCFLFHF